MSGEQTKDDSLLKLLRCSSHQHLACRKTGYAERLQRMVLTRGAKYFKIFKILNEKIAYLVLLKQFANVYLLKFWLKKQKS